MLQHSRGSTADDAETQAAVEVVQTEHMCRDVQVPCIYCVSSLATAANLISSIHLCAAARYGTVPDTFDPFMPGPMWKVVETYPYMNLHKVGLLGSDALLAWEAKRNAQRMVTLEGLLKEIGRESIDIFKIDCEVGPPSCNLGSNSE